MAFLPKNQAESQVSQRIQKTVDKISEAINPLLEAGKRGDFWKEVNEVIQGLEYWEKKKVIDETIKQLREAGWKAEHSFSQLDELFLIE